MPEGANNPAGAQSDGSGGGFSALDLSNPKDQALVRKVAERSGSRWPITAETRVKVVAGLETALKAADALIDAGEVRDGGNLHASVAKTFAALDKLNQTDEQEREKYARLDAGKDTERVTHTARIVTLPANINPENI
jgi:hypothetical protein